MTFEAAGHSQLVGRIFIWYRIILSALFVSQDYAIRKSIKKSTLELIDEIGKAQMKKEMMDKIVKLDKINEQKMSEELVLIH